MIFPTIGKEQMSRRAPDLVGQRFGKLIVEAFAYSNPKSHWLCRCDCGVRKIIRVDVLKKCGGCGCLSIERSTTHGMSQTRFNHIWRKIKIRCGNPNDPAYPDYGGRGIRVEWISFADFKRDMYESYLQHCDIHGLKDTTIDRIDNNGNYSMSNCRWATRQEQADNRRSNRLLTHRNTTMTAKQWARRLGMNYKTLHTELSRGWDFDQIAEIMLGGAEVKP